MDAHFEYPTLNELLAKFQGVERIVRQEQTVAMQRAVLPIERDAEGMAPWDMGHLRRSIASRIHLISDGVEGITGSNLPYAKIQEEGRRPGRMPPPGVLLGWMRRHGIPAESEFLIRRAIGRHGTPPQPYLIPAFKKNIPNANRELGRMLADRIMRKLIAGR